MLQPLVCVLVACFQFGFYQVIVYCYALVDFRYDLGTSTWSRVEAQSSVSPRARYGHTLVVYGVSHVLYTIGHIFDHCLLKFCVKSAHFKAFESCFVTVHSSSITLIMHDGVR